MTIEGRRRQVQFGRLLPGGEPPGPTDARIAAIVALAFVALVALRRGFRSVLGG